MISVQNLQQLLSGNKSLFFVLIAAFAMQSCGIFGKGSKTPPPPPPPIEDTTEKEPEVKDTVAIAPPDVIVEDTTKKQDPIILKDVVNIGVILPFQLDSMEQSNQISQSSRYSLEIYNGIQAAIDGVTFKDEIVNLYVFDNANSDVETRKILQKEELKTMDAIIGPLFTKNIQAVSSFALQNKISFFSPLSSSPSIASNNPFIYSAIPTKETRYKQLFSFIKDEFDDPNVSIIFQPLPKELSAMNELVEYAKQANQPVETKQSEGRTMFTVANEVLDRDRPNVIILPVDDNDEGKLYLDRMLSYLETMSSRYDIQVIGLQEWNGVSSIAPNKYPSVDFYIIDRYFVDNGRPRKAQEYGRLMMEHPNQNLDYLIQGYDLMNYFIQLIDKYGEDFANHFDRQYEGLQIAYQFDDFVKDGGTQFKENKSVNILQYQGNEWKKVN